MAVAWADFPDVRQSVDLLRRSLERGRLGHAYLFTGENPELLEGVARELSAAVNCTAAQETSVPGQLPTQACGSCPSCRRIREGLHPDVHWLRAESKMRIIRIEQVRELLNAVQLKANEARYKVAILFGADRLSSEAANAFLKTLEEPPPRSLFILVSTEPDRVLATILSRCLRLSFPAVDPPGEADLAWLKQFALELERPSRSLLGRYRLLGILLRRLAEVRERVETDIEARSPGRQYQDADSSLAEQWENEAKAAVEAEFRRQRGRTVRLLQEWLRDVWLMTQNQPAHLLAIPALERSTGIVAARLDPDRAVANLGLLESTQSLLHTNVQEALALEVALLRLSL